MTTMWAGVRERVLALRAAPGARRVFGAFFKGHGHGFELSPPLTGAEVAEIETALGTSLPGEYRGFLMEVGAGGAGPDYGLFPPALPPEENRAALAGRLRRPFRPDHAQRALDEYDEREPSRDAYPDEEGYRRAFGAWDDEFDELDEALVAGTLCVSDRGCGYHTLLVVTGPERGTVWEDVRAVGMGVVPLGDGDGGRMTFAEWYLEWLSHAERRAAEKPQGAAGEEPESAAGAGEGDAATP
ncbi:SMI1/KNR4 family protein [Streptosporangium sp. NPDC048047]|uniref:SMI1/KNR4 family protein n=1 Tax=Streptosporangium sp. NPDC048047 TaxID=3155748 RepID=UPI0034328C88